MRVWSFVLIVAARLYMQRDASFALHVVGVCVVARNALERRKEVYSPSLSEDIVKTIYRLKRGWKRPMTESTESLIQQSLKAVDSKVVCEVCIAEQNNQCEECCLK